MAMAGDMWACAHYAIFYHALIFSGKLIVYVLKTVSKNDIP